VVDRAAWVHANVSTFAALIGRLERELGIRLFARSTRSLRLTAEGEAYLPYAREVLETLREGRERFQGESRSWRSTSLTVTSSNPVTSRRSKVSGRP